MELEMADLMAEIDVAAYVLDALPNMNEDMVKEHVEPFVKRLRAAHKDVPIVLVESLCRVKDCSSGGLSHSWLSLRRAET